MKAMRARETPSGKPSLGGKSEGAATQFGKGFEHDFTSVPASTREYTGPLGARPTLNIGKRRGPFPRACGGYSWFVEWKLDQKTSVGGWVVQALTFHPDVRTCDDKPFKMPGQDLQNLNPGWFPFWEAWEIKKDQDTAADEDRYVSSDVTANGQPTKGSFRVTGQAAFHEGLTLPKLFKLGRPPAHDIHSTGTNPQLGLGSGAIPHNVKVAWNCCPGSTDRQSEVTHPGGGGAP